MKLVTINHDVITGEITEIELTKQEITAREKMAKDANDANKEFQAEAEAKAQAKATAEGKLFALGLTTDDLRALGL
jgi:hypothetical protein